MDRRDFLKTTLGAIAASGVPLGATQGGGGPTIQLQMYCKGQFLHITENGKFHLACLKNTAAHAPHLARLYVPVAALGEGAPPGFNDVEEWRGYELQGNIVLTGEDGSPLPQTPPAKRAAQTASGDERPFPEPPENDAEWNYPEFVPQLKKISPGCKLKSTWRDECQSIFGPIQRNQLRIHKPCKKEDTVAVFVWRGSDNKPVRICAASDMVSYPYFLSPAVRAVRLNIGATRVPLRLTGDPVNIAQICAPERANPPARTAYAAGREIEHFQNIYRVVDLKNAKKAKMYYLGQSTIPTETHETKCLKPFTVKDDDIFCPGGEPPP